MYRRDRLKIETLRTGDPSDWRNFKKLRNEVNNSIKNVKKSPTTIKPLKITIEIPARHGKLSMK